MKSLLQSTLILSLLALPLAAQPGPDMPHHAERADRGLQLTEAQKTSIRTIREKHHSDLVQRRDAVMHARIDLRTALHDPATPESRLRALYDKASSARLDLILAQRSTRQEVLAVLTPEQRARAAEMRGMAHRRVRERPQEGRTDAWMGR